MKSAGCCALSCPQNHCLFLTQVSDPIIFGRAVRAYLANTCATHHEAIEEIGVNFNDGLGAVLDQIRKSNYHPVAVDAILGDFEKEMKAAAPIAMVDSDRGITNLHVPSDVIIDASMPAMIRDSGKMWSAAGELEDAKAVIPDSSYADLYQVCSNVLLSSKSVVALKVVDLV